MTAASSPKTDESITNLTAEVLDIDPAALKSWIEHASDWTVANVLTLDTAIEAIIILAAISVGFMIDKISSAKLAQVINRLHAPHIVKRVLQKIRKSLAPVSIFILLSLCLTFLPSMIPDIRLGLVDAVTRLTAAWIVIRLVVQIVHNPTMRNVIAFITWSIAALSIFGFLDDTVEALNATSLTIGDFQLTALTVVKCLFATMIMVYIASSISRTVERRLINIPAMTSGSRLLIGKIVRIVLTILAVMIGLTMAGVNLSALAVFSGAVGIGVGLGLQRGVSNLFTGMMLLMDRTIQPGDVIELSTGGIGTVKQMGSRCTEVITLDRRSYLIPNEELVTQPVINWSRGGRESLVSVVFGVDYSHNPHQIITLARATTDGHPRILQFPEPSCLFTGFGDNSLDFQLNFWIADPENGTAGIKSEILLALWDVFDQHDIKIPYPHREVFIHNKS
ncbi:mechanosensitive ion channel family protein [Micavibrio aeruginosavorus]|uniref:MscS Mechanosensitive ion channel n=1 Tax=Micavibrio aeruginosavorus EPB TaxID=349215 RepID=M4VDL2_9BACT|nr:mechanosensitive ion channel domain-containing protein [Micavibrio aeruginosavorus]AGH97318.1 MscS Mechanosensitive ion channel [Micavibrio aeruginosavorus EPB]